MQVCQPGPCVNHTHEFAIARSKTVRQSRNNTWHTSNPPTQPDLHKRHDLRLRTLLRGFDTNQSRGKRTQIKAEASASPRPPFGRMAHRSVERPVPDLPDMPGERTEQVFPTPSTPTATHHTSPISRDNSNGKVETKAPTAASHPTWPGPFHGARQRQVQLAAFRDDCLITSKQEFRDRGPCLWSQSIPPFLQKGPQLHDTMKQTSNHACRVSSAARRTGRAIATRRRLCTGTATPVPSGLGQGLLHIVQHGRALPPP